MKADAARIAYDQELASAIGKVPPMDLHAGTLIETRSMIEGFYGLLEKGGPAPTVVMAPGFRGNPEVELRIFRPERSTADGSRAMPAIYDIHGGGYVLGSAAAMDGLYAKVASDFGAVVIAPDYRLAPEAPFPAPHDDCRAGLEWVIAHSAALGIDPATIVIRGESAGGGLAAGLALALRDSGSFAPAGLMLLYPMLDHRTGTTSSPYCNPFVDELGWSRAANCFGWESLRGASVNDRPLHHFSPALAEELHGMPPTFIGVGGLDLFVDEAAAFAMRLLRSGTAVDLHIYPGAPHGFDVLAAALIGQRTKLCDCFLADQQAAFRRWIQDGRPPGLDQ